MPLPHCYVEARTLISFLLKQYRKWACCTLSQSSETVLPICRAILEQIIVWQQKCIFRGYAIGPESDAAEQSLQPSCTTLTSGMRPKHCPYMREQKDNWILFGKWYASLETLGGTNTHRTELKNHSVIGCSGTFKPCDARICGPVCCHTGWMEMQPPPGTHHRGSASSRRWWQASQLSARSKWPEWDQHHRRVEATWFPGCHWLLHHGQACKDRSVSRKRLEERA